MYLIQGYSIFRRDIASITLSYPLYLSLERSRVSVISMVSFTENLYLFKSVSLFLYIVGNGKKGSRQLFSTMHFSFAIPCCSTNLVLVNSLTAMIVLHCCNIFLFRELSGFHTSIPCASKMSRVAGDILFIKDPMSNKLIWLKIT